VETCEQLTASYKDEVLKLKYFEEFANLMQLKDKIEQNHQSIDQLLASYL
jgi:hypothetical protein